MDRERKIVFIIPYFGKFNNYFPLMLNSCACNPDIDWMLFTDDKSTYPYPPNVHIYYRTFEWLQSLIKNRFDFEVSIERPYKLCDYKVAYGFIFQDYIKEYQMWGYCDVDLVWGKISNFITDELISVYDKIGILGHCTLYKNTDEINTVFMKELDGKVRYKEVFREEWNHSFDEEFKGSINNIFYTYGYRVYDHLAIANIYMKSSNFKLTWQASREGYEVESLKKAFFVWTDGYLYRYMLENGQVVRTEYLYIHMQSRPMKVKLPENYKGDFKIIPNVFEKLEVAKIENTTFPKVRRKYFNLHYFKLRSRNLVDKLRKHLKYHKY